MSKMIYLSPTQLIEKYPEVASKFNWTPRELGLFLKCKLLDGYYDLDIMEDELDKQKNQCAR